MVQNIYVIELDICKETQTKDENVHVERECMHHFKIVKFDEGDVFEKCVCIRHSPINFTWLWTC